MTLAIRALMDIPNRAFDAPHSELAPTRAKAIQTISPQSRKGRREMRRTTQDFGLEPGSTGHLKIGKAGDCPIEQMRSHYCVCPPRPRGPRTNGPPPSLQPIGAWCWPPG